MIIFFPVPPIQSVVTINFYVLGSVSRCPSPSTSVSLSYKKFVFQMSSGKILNIGDKIQEKIGIRDIAH